MNEDDILSALKAMHYIRRIESKAAEMYRLRFIYGFLHLYIGQVNFMINRINRIIIFCFYRHISNTIETEKNLKIRMRRKKENKKERRKKKCICRKQ